MPSGARRGVQSRSAVAAVSFRRPAHQPRLRELPRARGARDVRRRAPRRGLTCASRRPGGAAFSWLALSAGCSSPKNADWAGFVFAAARCSPSRSRAASSSRGSCRPRDSPPDRLLGLGRLRFRSRSPRSTWSRSSRSETSRSSCARVSFAAPARSSRWISCSSRGAPGSKRRSPRSLSCSASSPLFPCSSSARSSCARTAIGSHSLSSGWRCFNT